MFLQEVLQNTFNNRVRESCLCWKESEKVDDVLSEASKISDHYFGVTTDVLDEEGLNYGFERVIEKFGKVDSLINGALEVICLVRQLVRIKKFSILISKTTVK